MNRILLLPMLPMLAAGCAAIDPRLPGTWESYRRDPTDSDSHYRLTIAWGEVTLTEFDEHGKPMGVPVTARLDPHPKEPDAYIVAPKDAPVGGGLLALAAHDGELFLQGPGAPGRFRRTK